MSEPLFGTGRLLITPGVRDLLSGESNEFGVVFDLIEKHRTLICPDLDDADNDANLAALDDGTRILTVYYIGDVKVWVITEADRSATTILLPSEY